MLMNQAQEFHNQQLAAQEVLAAQASDQRDETNKLLLSAVNVLTEQLEYMKNAGYRVGGMPENKAFGGFVHRFLSGGRVPGTGSGDKVRALLEPGEFVIEKNVANRYTSELEKLNKGEIDVREGRLDRRAVSTRRDDKYYTEAILDRRGRTGDERMGSTSIYYRQPRGSTQGVLSNQIEQKHIDVLGFSRGGPVYAAGGASISRTPEEEQKIAEYMTANNMLSQEEYDRLNKQWKSFTSDERRRVVQYRLFQNVKDTYSPEALDWYLRNSGVAGQKKDQERQARDTERQQNQISNLQGQQVLSGSEGEKQHLDRKIQMINLDLLEQQKQNELEEIRKQHYQSNWFTGSN